VNVDEALEAATHPYRTDIEAVLAAEVREWRRVGSAILCTHRSGDVVLLQDDADAIERLLGGTEAG
jgi:hypothetical protein